MDSFHSLICVAADVFGVTPKDIANKRRFEAVADARRAVIAIACEIAPQAYVWRWFKLDHSSVSYMVRRFKDKCEVDRVYRERVNQVRSTIKLASPRAEPGIVNQKTILGQGLRNLAFWIYNRLKTDHHPITTLSILERKTREIRERVEKGRV